MKEISSASLEDRGVKPSAFQKMAITASAMLFLGVGSGMSGNERSSSVPTPQSISTPPTLTVFDSECWIEPLIPPRWQDAIQVEIPVHVCMEHFL